MIEHRLRALLNPRSIAVVGASANRETFGWRSWQGVLEIGFEGDLFLVNPRYDEIDGMPCHSDIASIGQPVEHAMLNVSNANLEAVFSAAIEARVQAVTIFASCYLEGDQDPPLLERLKRKAQEASLLVCGGNGAGFVNRAEKVQVALSGSRSNLDVGPVTLISQSGSIYLGMIQTDGRLGFNLTVSSGQEIATTAADYMDYALELESTRAIALFIETIRDPAGFCRAADKANERGVPVVVVKAARTEESVRMAQTHSGALAGNDAACDAVFRHHGVLRVRDLDAMIATLQMAVQPRRYRPGGIVAITDSGGEREHLVDLAHDHGIPFAAISEETNRRMEKCLDYGLEAVNPLDAWGTGRDYVPIFEECWDALMSDQDCSAGIWVADLRDFDLFRTPFIERARRIAERTGKPMCFASCVPNGIVHEKARYLAEAGIPLIDGLGPALTAFSRMMAWRDHRDHRTMRPPEPPAGAIVNQWRDRLTTGDPLDEAEGLALARDFGLAAPETVIVQTEQEVRDTAVRTGGPLALKTAMPGLRHKSDVGGVTLGIRGEEDLLEAWQEMARRLGPRALIAPMAPAGVEMMFGLVRDHQFGPLVLVGTGGVLTEVLDDSLLALPPFDVTFARALIDRLKVRPLLDGARGRPACDGAALAEALARFSVLVASLGDHIAELDFNPVIAGPGGAVAVDALVIPDRDSI